MQADHHYNNSDILLQDFKSGNTAALQTLYNLHYKALWYFANRLLGDAEQAEDIAAETFIKLWNTRYQFKQLENIRPFLFVVTRNACITHLKQLKRRMVSHREIGYLSPWSEEDVSNEQIRAELVQEALLQAEAMPPQMKKIFSLFYVEGKSLSEIADDLHVSINTVRSQKVNALKRVRDAFSKKGLIVRCILLLLLFR
ncbi:MAG: sigma-70 family RNA polymerase sigma factor [Williamsia sp.]|nr:sigma-70 family RNA polymerase sigma factor [Williamsia sp.]